MILDELIVKLGLDMSDYAKSLQQAGLGLEEVSSKFIGAGAALTAGISAPLGAIALESVKAAASFEAAMNKVAALSEASGKDLEKLTEFALEMGKKTQFSAKQAADAMGEMAAAGFNTEQMMQGLPGVMDLAAAGGLKLAEAAQISAGILGGFGLQASQMGDAANVIAKAASISAISVQDLGYSFKYIGPVARAAGISFTETAAALAILGNAGIRGESAGTALRNMINDLANPSEKAAKVMERLGITVFDVQGKMLPLTKIVEELHGKNLTLAEGFQIFGARYSDVLPLIQKGSAELEKNTETLSKASTAARDMAATMRKGLAGTWEQFTGSVETLGIAFGKLLMPVLEPTVKFFQVLADKATDLAVGFGKLPGPVQAVVGLLAAIPVAIGPALLAIGGLTRAFAEIQGLQKLLTGFTATKVKIEVDPASLTQVQGLGTLVKNVFNDLTTYGKTLPGTLSTAFKGGVSAVAENMKAISSAVVEGVKNIPTLLKGGVDAFSTFGKGIFESLKSAGPLVKAGMAAAFEGVSSAMSSLSQAGVAGTMDNLKGSLLTFASSVGPALTAAFTAMKAGALSFGASLLTIGLPLAAIIAGAAALAAVAYTVYKNWDDVKAVLIGMWKDLQNAVQAYWKVVEAVLGPTVTSWLKSIWSGYFAYLKTLWDGMVNAWNNGLKWFVQAALAATKAVGMEETSKALQAWLDKLSGAGKNLEVVGNAAKGLVSHINNAADAQKRVQDLVQVTGQFYDTVGAKIRLGTLAEQEKKNLINESNRLIAQTKTAYAEILEAEKAGKITKEQSLKAQKELAQNIDALKGSVQELAPATLQVGAAFESAAVSKKKAASAAREAATAAKAGEDAFRKVADVMSALPRSWGDFTKAMETGYKPEKDLVRLKETLSDLEIKYRNAGDAVKTAIGQSMETLREAIKHQETWIKQWRAFDLDKEVFQKINATIRDSALKDLPTLLKMPPGTIAESYKPVQIALTDLELKVLDLKDAYKFFGIEGADAAAKVASGGKAAAENYKDLAEKAGKFYEILRDSGTATPDQLKTAWKKYQDYLAQSLIPNLNGVSDAFKQLGLDVEGLNSRIFGKAEGKTAAQISLENLQDAYKTVKESGLATTEELRKAWGKVLDAQVTAAEEGAKRSTLASSGFFGFLESQSALSGAKLQKNIFDATENLKNNLTKGFGDLFGNIFSGNFDKIGQSFTALKTTFLSGLGGLLDPIKKQASELLNSLSKGITDFVTQQITGKLMGAFTQVMGQLPLIGKSFGAVFGSTQSGVNLVSMGKDLTQTLTQATNATAQVTKNITQATDALSRASTTLSAATSTVSKSGEVATQMAGTVTKTANQVAQNFLTNFVSPISAAVSAVTGVLSFLQGRRQEQDIGRIEVTSRGILNQTVSLQGTMNEYFPQFRDLLTWTAKGMNTSSIGDSFADTMDPIFKILLTATSAIEAIRDDVRGFSQSSGGTKGGGLSTATSSLQQLAQSITEVGKESGAAEETFRKTVTTLKETGSSTSTLTKSFTEVASSTERVTTASQAATPAIASQARGTEVVTTASQQLTTTLNVAGKSISATGNVVINIGSVFQETTKKMTEVALRAGATNNALGPFAAFTGRVGEAAKEAQPGIQVLVGSIDTLGGTGGAATTAAEKVQTGATALNFEFVDAGNSIQTSAVNASTNIGTGAAAVSESLGNLGTSLYNTVKTITGPPAMAVQEAVTVSEQVTTVAGAARELLYQSFAGMGEAIAIGGDAVATAAGQASEKILAGASRFTPGGSLTGTRATAATIKTGPMTPSLTEMYGELGATGGANNPAFTPFSTEAHPFARFNPVETPVDPFGRELYGVRTQTTGTGKEAKTENLPSLTAEGWFPKNMQEVMGSVAWGKPVDFPTSQSPILGQMPVDGLGGQGSADVGGGDRTVNLNVNVNNADAEKVADEIVGALQNSGVFN